MNMKIFTLLFCAAFLAACAGASRLERNVLQQPTEDEVVVYESCMSTVRDGRAELPPAASFVQDLAVSIFSCEYFLGSPISILGEEVTIKGRPIHAGYGYALADGDLVIKELLSSTNFSTYYGVDIKGVTVVIEKHAVHLKEFDKNIEFYLVNGKHSLLPPRTVAALATVEFMQHNHPYTLFVWMQGSRLSEKVFTERLQKILPLVFVPEVRKA